MWGYLKKLRIQESEIDDIIQEAWTTAYLKRNSLLDFTKIENWIFKILKHIFLNKKRYEKRVPGVIELKPDIFFQNDVEACKFNLKSLCTLSPRLSVLIPELDWNESDDIELEFINNKGIKENSSQSKPAHNKRVQRFRSKCRLRHLLNSIIDPEVSSDKVFEYVSRQSFHVREGPIDSILKRAYRLRNAISIQAPLRERVIGLLDACSRKLYTYITNSNNRDASELFKSLYCTLKLGVLLNPEAIKENYGEFKKDFNRYRSSLPLLGRLLSRIDALTGDEDAIAKQRWYWDRCLHDSSTHNGFFGAAYCSMYFAGPYVGRQLLDSLHFGNNKSVSRLLKTNKDKIKNRIIAEASKNLREEWYTKSELWSETNFLRMHLALQYLDTYKRIDSIAKKRVKRVAEQARRLTHNTRLKKITSGIIGGLF